MPYSVPQIINIAKVSGYLAANAIEKGGLYGGGQDIKQPSKIYVVRKSVEWMFSKNPDVTAAKATATITVTDVGDNGDEIEIFVDDPVDGLVSLGSYTKQNTDTTTTILAASIVTACEGNSYGYEFTSQNAVITITANATGSDMNTGDRLSVVITPNTSPIPLTDLWGWWLADTGVTGTTSVSNWSDQSGGGNSLSQATTNRQPALYEDILNGYPVVGLKAASGSQARMVTADIFPFVDGATIIMVASQNNTGGNADFDGTFCEYTQGSVVFRDSSSDNVYLTINSDSGAYLSSLTNGTFYTIALTTDGVDITPYLNGVAGSGSSSELTVTQQPFYIFQNHLNANTGNKRFAEIIVYTRVLSGSELTQVFSYLQSKYQHY